MKSLKYCSRILRIVNSIVIEEKIKQKKWESSVNNKSILVTGATGSFGKAFIKFLTKKYKKIKRLVIFSRDELKQSEMAKVYDKKKYPFIRYF